jgi:3-dehydroquinate dehydratase-2
MKKLYYVINGSNLNLLGLREPDVYGRNDYKALVSCVKAKAKELGVRVKIYHSNHEGDLVDKIQEAYKAGAEGIVINPGAYTHTSIAILDAVKAVKLPTVEVHISKVEDREDFRQVSYIRLAALKTITGHGINGYAEALEFLANKH